MSADVLSSHTFGLLSISPIDATQCLFSVFTVERENGTVHVARDGIHFYEIVIKSRRELYHWTRATSSSRAELLSSLSDHF